ncbi:MAG: hypothetical protein ACE5EO_02815 [Candidatus Krumholzibacteriia bacterium]
MAAKKKKKKTATAPVALDGSLGPTPALRYQILAAVFVLVMAVCVLYPELVFQNKVMHAGDVEAAASFGTPIKHEMEAKGIYPLWNPYLYAGMPSYESLSYTPYVYPLSVVTNFLVKYVGFPNFTWLLFHILMLGIGVCVLLMERGVHYLIAAGAGVLMMWMPNHVAVGAHGHGSQAIAVAFIPFALLLWDRLWRGRGVLINASLLVIVLGFQMLRAHLQICYYTMALLGLHLLFFGVLQIRDGFRGRNGTEGGPHVELFHKTIWSARKTALVNVAAASLVFGVVIAAALASSAVLFAPVHDYAQYSIRGAAAGGGLEYDYATSWSLHPSEMLTFVVPFSFGFGVPTYYGHMPFTDYPNYVGIVVFLFAVAATLLVKTRYVRFLLFIVVLSTVVAFGKYVPILYDPLFHWLPFFNKFRVPVMILIVQQFAMVLLFAVGLAAVLRVEPAAGSRWTLRGLIIAAVMLVVALVTRDYWLNGYAGAIAPKLKFVRSVSEQAAYARFTADHLHKDLIKLSFILFAVFGLLLAYYKRYLKAAILVVLIAGIATVDLFAIDRYILRPQTLFPGAQRIIKDKSERDRFLQPDGVVNFLQQDKSLYRVFPMTHPSIPVERDFRTNRYMNFGISSIGGYHPAKLSIYEEFLQVLGTAFPAGNSGIIDMLNVKYLVLATPLPENPLYKQVWEGTNYRGERRIVYQNPRALDRVFFVDRYRVVPGDRELALLGSGRDIDTSREALLDRQPAIEPRSREGATASIRKYGFNEIRIDASLASPAILVLSEIFYPAWKVSIDGREGEVMRADHILRGVALPEGDHEVVFRYDSSLLKRSLSVSVVTFVVALTVLLFSLAVRMRGGGTWTRSS